ncbi:MAG TPA: hypothetical protein VFA07_06315 [Chthonomonadaceae bacterium]|nr:hypothetical protein [Chthonomonadaceae bacterium]
MTTSGQPYELGLTIEEALGLLDIMLVSPLELTSHQNMALQKLSEFCRQRLGATEAIPAAETIGNPRRASQIYRLLRVAVKPGRPCTETAGAEPQKE